MLSAFLEKCPHLLGTGVVWGCHKGDTSDGLPYEKRADGKGEPVCIAEEVPFEIPETWAWARLESLASILNGDRGKNYPAKSKLHESGIPFVSAVDIRNGIVVSDSMLYMDASQYDALRAGKLRKNDLVFCIRGSLGKHGIFPFEAGAIASSLVIVRPYVTENTLHDYLGLLFDSSLTDLGIKLHNNGTAQPNLSARDFQTFLYPVPPLAEQRRIVAALDRYLSLVDTVERDGQELDALLGRLRSKVLDLAVRGELTERDPSDEPAVELLSRIHAEKLAMVGRGELKPKDVKGDTVIFTGSDGLRYEKRADGRGEPVCIEDEIPFEIPETWAWARLGSLGRIVGGGTPKTSEPGYWAAAKKGIPWITPADMSTISGLMIDGGSRDITKAGLEKSSAQLLRSGAVVMSSRAPIGYIGIATHPLCTNQGCKSVDLALPELGVWIAMCLRGLMTEILRRASGTTFQEISGSEFSRILVPIAPLNEQKRARLLYFELHNSLTNL